MINEGIEINGTMDLGKASPIEQQESEIMETVEDNPIKKLNEKQLRKIIHNCLSEAIKERAKSKSQQRFFGMVDAYKKGDMPDASTAIKKAAKGMTNKEVKDVAKTKHKGLPEHVDESKLRTLVRNTLMRLRESINLPTNEEPNENVYTMEDWRRDGTLKVQEGQLISPDVFFQLLESVPPASTGRIFQPGEAYDHDWKTGQALYMTFKNEGDNYYRYVGLQPAAKYSTTEHSQPLYRAINENTKTLDKKITESVQTALVNVLGKYTQGKTSSKEANKAIMDLANSSNGRVNERNNRNFYDYADEYMRQNGKKLPDDVLKHAAEKNDERFHNRRKRDGKYNYVPQTKDYNQVMGRLNEGDGNSPYYGEKHDMENKKIENLGNMKWGKFKK